MGNRSFVLKILLLSVIGMGSLGLAVQDHARAFLSYLAWNNDQKIESQKLTTYSEVKNFLVKDSPLVKVDIKETTQDVAWKIPYISSEQNGKSGQIYLQRQISEVLKPSKEPKKHSIVYELVLADDTKNLITMTEKELIEIDGKTVEKPQWRYYGEAKEDKELPPAVFFDLKKAVPLAGQDQKQAWELSTASIAQIIFSAPYFKVLGQKASIPVYRHSLELRIMLDGPRVIGLSRRIQIADKIRRIFHNVEEFTQVVLGKS